MPANSDILSELILDPGTDGAASRRFRRLAAGGHLRKLHRGIYTSNKSAAPEAVVMRHWQSIVGYLLPGGVASHRSAFEGRPTEGYLILTRGKTRRDLKLPGLTVRVLPGPAARRQVPNDTAYGAIFISSDPRRYLENLTRGRGWSQNVVSQERVEQGLDRILMIGGEARLNQLRDQARSLAPEFGFQAQFKRLDALIGALLGTHETRKLTARQAIARAAGRPYDPARLEIFDALFATLNGSTLPDIPDTAVSGVAQENFAFFEAYFSNYIEGTTFTVEEAEDIVFNGRMIPGRDEDSHDILGTFNAAIGSPWRDRPPQTADELSSWLRSVNALVMQGRTGKNPGEWKDKPNQSGSTLFVAPDLVPGTLREGFERIGALKHALARALMSMFVVTEVHPFLDGNGRTARLLMNSVLSAAGLSRIAIPTVYREDYLLPLKELSHHGNAEPLVASMTRIQRWSAAFDYKQPRPQVREVLARCNAFQEDLRTYRLIFP